MIRRLILAALLLGCTTCVGARAWIAQLPAGTGFSLVAHAGANANNTNTATTSAFDSTGANLIRVCKARWLQGSPALTAPTDNKGNTYTQIGTEVNDATGPDVGLSQWYALVPTVGSGHTVSSVTSGVEFVTLEVEAFSGAAAASALDQSAAASGTNQAGSVTPVQNGELLTACYGEQAFDTGIMSINSGFTITDQFSFASGNNVGGAMAWFVQTTAAAINPTWTTTGATTGASGIATFKHP